MKIRFFFLVLLANGFFLFPEESYEIKVRSIIEDISVVVHASDNEILLDTWNRAIAEYNREQLHFIIDNDESGSVIGGNSFSFDRDSPDIPQEIIIDQKLLMLYPEKKNLVTAIVMHEIRHAADYYSNPENFAIIEDNLLERFLYDMDAYHVEALFLEAAVAEDREMTLFERIMLDSFHNDDLETLSLIINDVDKDLVYYLLSRREEVGQGTLTVADLLSECIRVGRELENRYDGKETYTADWMAYYTWVQMNTYILFIPLIVNPHIDDRILTDEAENIDTLNRCIGGMIADCAVIYGNYSEYGRELKSKLFLFEGEI